MGRTVGLFYPFPIRSNTGPKWTMHSKVEEAELRFTPTWGNFGVAKPAKLGKNHVPGHLTILKIWVAIKQLL